MTAGRAKRWIVVVTFGTSALLLALAALAATWRG